MTALAGAEPRRTTLLILCTCSHVGGVERLVLGLSRQFSDRGWEVETVFPHPTDDPGFLEWCRDDGVEAVSSPRLKDLARAHGLGTILALRSLVAARKPDVVNIHFGDGHASLKDVLAIRAAGVQRLILSIHHPTPWSEAGTRKRQLTGLAARLADGVVVNSRATAQLMIEAGVHRRKLIVIPPGVPSRCSELTKEAARARLAIPDRAFVVGGLGRLKPEKGFATLIEALGLLRDDGPIEVVLAGDGPERAALESLAERLGVQARFLGRVAEPNDLYRASDVFALPSELEGFGLVFVEAAMNGVPSIGTSVGGIPDAIEDGTTGLLVPPRDAPALAAAIGRLWRDPGLRAAMGQAACQRAHAEFTEERMADRYAELLSTSSAGAAAGPVPDARRWLG